MESTVRQPGFAERGFVPLCSGFLGRLYEAFSRIPVLLLILMCTSISASQWNH
jgi:hypothetical protein